MVLARYRERILNYGVSADSLKSGSIEKQNARHEAHASIIKIENPRILDIGCGIGQFSSFLTTHGIKHQYVGYDIVEEYIAYCKANFPQGEFQLRNVFEEGIEGQFDYIFLSQVLNNRFRDSDNNMVMKEMIRICLKHIRIGLSIDMMSKYVDYQSEELFYYSPEEMFSFAKSLKKRVLLRHDFRPFEFCLQIFNDDAPGFVK